MKFLLNLFKISPKGDNYRAIDSPEKYADNIAALNSAGNTKKPSNTQSLSKASKNKNALSQTSTGNSIPPGVR
jgi:hypothetical protein